MDALLGDRYALGARIGRGGLGDVVAARDLELRRPVAVKLLHPHLRHDRTAVACFLAGSRAAAAVMHPGIVAVYDAGWADDGRPFVVMELVDGHSLAAEVTERGPLPEARVAEIGHCLAGALHAAHARGVLHGDVKPGNVLLAVDGRVLLADFGAVDLARGRGARGDVLGTAGYIAPELLRGEGASATADVYGLGATLLHAVRGGDPWADPRDRRLAVVLARAVADDPSARWPSPRRLEAELAAIAPEAATGVLPVSKARTRELRPPAIAAETRRQLPAAGRRRRRPRLERLLGLTALGLIALALLPALLLGDQTSGRSDPSGSGGRTSRTGTQSGPGARSGGATRSSTPVAPRPVDPSAPPPVVLPGPPAPPPLP